MYITLAFSLHVNLCSYSFCFVLLFIETNWKTRRCKELLTRDVEESMQRCVFSARALLELLHTHLGFIFSKVIPCLLVIISHYPVSYILGENIPPGEYSLSVDTSV
jgi:hypothetical protein